MNAKFDIWLHVFIPKVFLSAAAAAGSMIFLPEKPLERVPSEQAFLA